MTRNGKVEVKKPRNDWQNLRRKLATKRHSKAISPEELLVYFHHLQECPYTGDPIRVEHHGRKIRIVIGEDVFEIPRKTQDFFKMHLRFDRFLKGRLGWVPPPANGKAKQGKLAL